VEAVFRENSEHKIMIVYKEHQTTVCVVQFQGHGTEKTTHLLLHGLQWLLQGVRKATRFWCTEGMQTCSKLCIAAGYEVWVRIGWHEQILLIRLSK